MHNRLTDRHTDVQRETVHPCHCCVVGYNKALKFVIHTSEIFFSTHIQIFNVFEEFFFHFPLSLLPLTERRKGDAVFNPFMPSGLFYHLSLYQSISKNRSVWFSLLSQFIEIAVLNANSMDTVRCHTLWQLIWVYTVSQCLFYGTLGINGLTLKALLKLHLKMSSVYVVCRIFLQTFQTYFCIQANRVDPDQTAPKGADNKADDNSCDWRFKGKVNIQFKIVTNVNTHGLTTFHKISTV